MRCSQFLIHPPNDDKYNTLKNALINIYGKSQLQKDCELLSLDGLGDRQPSALMRKIEALNDDPKTPKRALFLANLPSDIRTILLSHNPTEMKDLATTADQIWEAQRTSLQHTTSVTNVPQYNALDVPTSTSTYLQAAAPPTVETAVSQKPAHKKQPFSKNGNGSTNTAATICFYHTKFGPDARQPGCKSAPLLSNNSPNVYSARDVKRNTLSVHDKKSSSYLVDTGADVSVYPAAKNERKSSMLSTCCCNSSLLHSQLWC